MKLATGKNSYWKEIHSSDNTYYAVVITFYLTLFSLLIISFKSPSPLLLGKRFWGEVGGVVQSLFHALYSAIIVKMLLVSKKTKKIRSLIWTFFSFFFFFQLLLGLCGFNKFLMSGELHYPVPALILSSPLFRGEGFFMVGLLLTTIILVGPSWCSHLCYVGAIDNFFSTRGNNSSIRFKKKRINDFVSVRWISLFLAISLPLIFRRLTGGLGDFIIHLAIIFFILLSFFFFYLSFLAKKMVYCSSFCPVGVITNYLGKLNPFHIKINGDLCNSCSRCFSACSYGALGIKEIERGKAGITCSLCLDCLPICNKNLIQLKLGRYPWDARPVFYTIIVTLHSIFLATARI